MARLSLDPFGRGTGLYRLGFGQVDIQHGTADHAALLTALSRQLHAGESAIEWVMNNVSYRRHRFPPEIIQHAVWLYFHFPLSYRNSEDVSPKVEGAHRAAFIIDARAYFRAAKAEMLLARHSGRAGR